MNQFNPGDHVLVNGHEGRVLRVYMGTIVEIRLPRGEVCVSLSEVRKVGSNAKSQGQEDSKNENQVSQ